MAETVSVLCIGKAHTSPEYLPTDLSLPVPGKNFTVTLTAGFQGGLESGQFAMGWRARREGVGEEKRMSPPRVPATGSFVEVVWYKIKTEKSTWYSSFD